MNLVVDANVLVGELLRQRGRDLLRNSEFRLYAAEKVLSETCHEFQRRVMAMSAQGRLTDGTGQKLQALANQTIETHITHIPHVKL